MIKKINNIFRNARQLRLEKDKKNSIRNSVLTFVKENPLEASRSQIFWTSKNLLPRLLLVTSSLAVVLVAGGFASVQAESALPGDALYPVKVGFNEKIQKVLAFTEEAKINLDMDLVELRLKEAEKLALDGKITKENQQQINNNFNAQAKKVSERIDKLNSAKKYSIAEKISSDFEASLKAHTKVLEKISEIKNSKTAENIGTLITGVTSVSVKTSDSGALSIKNEINHADENNQTDARTLAREKIAQNRLESAQKAIDNARELINNKKDKVLKEDIAVAEERLKQAEQKIEEGKAKISGEEKDFAAAISLFREAGVIAKESKKLIEVRKNLKIEN